MASEATLLPRPSTRSTWSSLICKKGSVMPETSCCGEKFDSSSDLRARTAVGMSCDGAKEGGNACYAPVRAMYGEKILHTSATHTPPPPADLFVLGLAEDGWLDGADLQQQGARGCDDAMRALREEQQDPEPERSPWELAGAGKQHLQTWGHTARQGRDPCGWLALRKGWPVGDGATTTTEGGETPENERPH